ncbi:hypothetical protein HS1genome_0806 [Sulfodiicoccus acidiphilus]|uniref:Uncharacterized protein n=1 Tax=Sulfodiicoccus acidiphilus TaxID=1670455 RepID=A0A348B2L5_9CREN|nr:hypothetical protein [Sulfodiicoccus acidiphilus]BBD72417.1 hypothetical protein HS1genome_0806 [Sulfodiicoccus acidiphilus]GGT97284.1 hypothetical protein GCM10007116_13500 [Sulfodiicoccus acidiphilus]
MLLKPEQLGIEKLIRVDGGECWKYIGEAGEEVFTLYVYKGDLSLYFKVIRNSTGEEGCRGALLSPVGLYGFVKSEEELPNAVKEKLRRMIDREA